MNWKDVALKINEELVKFRRCDVRCSHILVGRKEYEEICKLENVDQEEHLDSSIWRIKLVKVDKDSYLVGAYIPTQKELDAKRLKEVMENNSPA